VAVLDTGDGKLYSKIFEFEELVMRGDCHGWWNEV
jgi:hypothetical protein